MVFWLAWLRIWRWCWRPGCQHLKHEILASQTHSLGHCEGGPESAMVHWGPGILSRHRYHCPALCELLNWNADWSASGSAHAAVFALAMRFLDQIRVSVVGTWEPARALHRWNPVMMRDDVEASWTCCVTEVQIRNPRLVRWRVRVEPLKPIIKKKLVVKKNDKTDN